MVWLGTCLIACNEQTRLVAIPTDNYHHITIHTQKKKNLVDDDDDDDDDQDNDQDKGIDQDDDDDDQYTDSDDDDDDIDEVELVLVYGLSWN